MTDSLNALDDQPVVEDGDDWPMIPTAEPRDLTQTPSEVEPDMHTGSGTTGHQPEAEQAAPGDPEDDQLLLCRDCGNAAGSPSRCTHCGSERLAPMVEPDVGLGVVEPDDEAADGKRRFNTQLRKITGTATAGDESTYSEGEFCRSWSLAHGLGEYLFVKGMGWLTYDAGIWRDGAGAARRSMAGLVKDTVSHTKFAPRFDRYNSIDGALKMAQVEPTEDRTVELGDFDSDPMAIGLSGGRIFDIAKGAERPAEPNDRIRKALATAPDPEPSQAWADFVYQSLSHYAEGQRDLVSGWLQEFCGTMLTGDCRDQKCLFLWGEPGTGKTVFAETLRHVMGEYSAVVTGDRIAGRESGHRQWLVGLAGRRLVLINELPERGTWRTVDLNALIEGSGIEANSMHQNSVNFESQASVLIVGNHRPRASAASGIWRRLVQVKFRNKPADPDPDLLAKLKGEAAGVLAWMLEGAERWQERGRLPEVPAPIRQAVKAYRMEADPFARFLEERTEEAPADSVGADVLYTAFRDWWLAEVDSDEKAVPKKRGFGIKLSEAGWPESQSVNGRRVRYGHRLKDAHAAPVLVMDRSGDRLV